MNILVTGGLGLIGHNVVKRLQADGVHPSWAGYKKLAEETK